MKLPKFTKMTSIKQETCDILQNIKQEDSVEYLLILPLEQEFLPRIDETAVKYELKELTVKLSTNAKFKRWKTKLELFQTVFVCSRSDNLFSNLCCFKKHEKVCNEIVCSECGKKFQSRKGLNSHIRLIRKRSNKCEICDQRFGCVLLKKRHIADYHGNKYTCVECSAVSKNGDKLTKHRRNHIKTFPCETCDKSYSRSPLLVHHQRIQCHGKFANEPLLRFKCNICGKLSTSEKALSNHFLCVHEDEKLECDFCSKIYKNKRSMFCHILNHFKIPCKICSKMYSKLKLHQHYKEHRDGNKFECDLCSKRFKLKHHVMQHMSSHALLKSSRSKRKVIDNASV